MEVLVIVVHVVAALMLSAVILLQSGKGGGMGAGFGGASSAATQIFGGRGATGFLGNSTVGLATTFMVTSLTLAYISAAPQTKMDLTETDGVAPAQEDEVIETGSNAVPAASGDAKPVEIKPATDNAAPAEIKPVEEPVEKPAEPVEKPAEPVEKPAEEAKPADAPVDSAR